MASRTSDHLQKSTNVRSDLSRIAAASVARAFTWAPSVSASAALYLWTHPQRRTRPARELPVLATGEPIRIPYGMGSLAGWLWGVGPTVLLVHGWEGRGSQLGAFVEPLVAAGFSVVSFDAPAHGDSQGDRASLIRFADAIDAAVRAAGPVHGIVAHSMGSAASLLAIAGGLVVQRLVLVAPADPSRAIERFTEAVGLPEPVQTRMEQDLLARYGQGIRTLAAPLLAAGSPAPALVIHDHDDRWCPIDDARAYADARQDFVLLETRGLGHHRVLRDPGVVSSTVRYLQSAEVEPVPVTAPLSRPVDAIDAIDGLDITITAEEIMADLAWGR